jgi:molybdopterin/thiamine biosynthesis adenylyltransferase
VTYLAVSQEVSEKLKTEILDAAPLEGGAFCRLRAVDRDGVARFVLGDLIESAEPWAAQREDLLTPSGKRISAAVSIATAENCGLGFVHSHPSGPAALSGLDRETTSRLGETIGELIDGPFASVVVSPGGWAGALTDGARLIPFDRIAIVGRSVQLVKGSRVSVDRQLDDRQIRALGEDSQTLLRALRVAVVGVGGLGSPIAETLVRMGVGEVRLVDDDKLDTVSNARRIFGIRRRDVDTSSPRNKAEVVAGSLGGLGLGAEVVPIVGDIRDPAIQARLLDVDVLMSGTDTQSSRAALTELAVRGALPLIDVGVRVGVRGQSQLDALRFERRLQVPGGPCLWCWRTLDAERVRLELMPEADRDRLIQEGYVTGGVDGPVPSVAALTVAAAGAATSALLGMLCGALDTSPLGAGVDALTLEVVPFDQQRPDPDCICSRWR